MLAVQGQALRGHIENEQSFNRGNFIEVRVLLVILMM